MSINEESLLRLVDRMIPRMEEGISRLPYYLEDHPRSLLMAVREELRSLRRELLNRLKGEKEPDDERDERPRQV